MIPWKLSLLVVVAPLFALAQGVAERTAVTTADSLTHGNVCQNVTESIKRKIAARAPGEAERVVREELPEGITGRPSSCAAGLFSDVAAAMQAAGRLNEAQAFARKALAYLDESGSAENALRLAPLHILASVEIEQGLTAKARATYRKMQEISGGTPSERSLVHGIGAALAQIEGKWDEAESEYKLAAEGLASGGKEHSVDMANVLAGMAAVYLNQRQPVRALDAVGKALVILETARDAVPLDRLKFLNLRAAVFGRQGRWLEAEKDLSEAFSLAHGQSRVDPVELEGLAANYSVVLRKLHRRREATAVSAWAAALRSGPTISDQVVDVTELVRKPAR